MKQLLRSDLYKLNKARYFWICLVINIVLAVLSVFIIDFSYRVAGDAMATSLEAQDQAMQENGVNISTDGLARSYEDLSASSQMLALSFGSSLLLIGIVISLFAGGEFNHGTIKNIASSNYSRAKIYLSKLLISILAAIVFTLLYMAATTITATVLWGFGSTGSGFWTHVMQVTAIELLLAGAFASVFYMIAMLIRQSGAAIAVNLCFLEFFSMIFMLLEMLYKKISGDTIVLSKYLLDTNITEVATKELTSSLATRSIVTALVYLAVTICIGMVVFSKKDIK